MTRIAMLGCGYVANMYRLTMPAHRELELAGVYDHETSRAQSMAELTGAACYSSFEALLEDESAQIVLNLTSPRAHYETTRALLDAGKHVYTEKPIAMDLDAATDLVERAEARNLMLVSAPCTLLNPVAQTVWRSLRDGAIGPVRLVYAEMDDGMVPRAPTAKWINEAGVAWPALDEFETGCTIEHAGYVLSWLCAFFGPIIRLDAFSETLTTDKIPDVALRAAPDFSVSCMKFADGVVVRMTNGLYAEHDHRLVFHGDDGALMVEDPRSDRSPIRLRRYRTLRRRRYLDKGRPVPLLGGKERIARYRGSQTRDFCRMIAAMSRALDGPRPAHLNARFSLHVAEATLACQAGAAGYVPRTRFERPEPAT